MSENNLKLFPVETHSLSATTKTCSKCHVEKLLTEFLIRKSGRYKGCHRSQCQDCEKEVSLSHYYAHKEERKHSKSLYLSDQENYRKMKETERQYKNLHREEIKEKSAARHTKNKERNNATSRKYYASHKAEAKIRWGKWRKEHPDEANSQKALSRARKANAPINDLTPKQWKEIKAAYEYRCVYCGEKNNRLEQDHIIPLSKGGGHTASNVVPACRSCNSKKHDGPPLKSVQLLLLTIEQPKPYIYRPHTRKSSPHLTELPQGVFPQLHDTPPENAE